MLGLKEKSSLLKHLFLTTPIALFSKIEDDFAYCLNQYSIIPACQYPDPLAGNDNNINTNIFKML
jgi:hypothetical protein